MASKEKEREREKEKDKEKDKERERELEMEAALYTNCLLLGLDVSILGQGGVPRSGLFRHSNPRMGETLLHFLLSALRGPAQSVKVSHRSLSTFNELDEDLRLFYIFASVHLASMPNIGLKKGADWNMKT